MGNEFGAARVDQISMLHSRGRGYARVHQGIRRDGGHPESPEVEEEVEFESGKCNLVYFGVFTGVWWSR